MRLIDADALKKEWSMGLGSCDDCPQNTRRCQLDMDFTRMDICGMIDDAPTVGGWISVKDRLPEIGDTVLFTGLSSFGTRFIPQRGWFDGTFWKRDTGETVYSSTPVTHWMPLPSTEGLDET